MFHYYFFIVGPCGEGARHFQLFGRRQRRRRHGRGVRRGLPDGSKFSGSSPNLQL